MTAAEPRPWPGCHGVRLADSPFDLGSASGTPLREATVTVGELPAAREDELWHIHDEIETAGGKREIDRWLCRHPDGDLVVHASAGPAVGINLSTNAITVEEGEAHVTLQLLTSFAIPMLLNGSDVLVLHASACVVDGGAMVICGPSGSGKSSTLVALVDAGFEALSEDVCAVDLSGDVPMVWPGPPWVRRRHDEDGPPGSSPRFESPDKVAWDISPWQAHAAVPVTQLVFLDRPGGSAPERHELSQARAVQALGGQAAWLLDPADAAAHLFPAALALTHHVERSRVRFPRDPAWMSSVAPLLAPRTP